MSVASQRTESSTLSDEFTPPNTPRPPRRTISPTDIDVNNVTSPRHSIRPRRAAVAPAADRAVARPYGKPSLAFSAAKVSSSAPKKEPQGVPNWYDPEPRASSNVPHMNQGWHVSPPSTPPLRGKGVRGDLAYIESREPPTVFPSRYNSDGPARSSGGEPQWPNSQPPFGEVKPAEHPLLSGLKWV